MDLINSLTSALGVDTHTAQALAGGVLGQVKDQLGASGEPGAAEELSGAVPELGGWAQAGQQLLGSGDVGSMLGGGGGLLGAAAGLLGGDAGQAAGLVALVGKLGLNADTLVKVAPIVLQFLGTRLSPELLAQVKGLIPGLSGAAPGSEGGQGGAGIGDLLGGLLG